MIIDMNPVPDLGSLALNCEWLLKKGGPSPPWDHFAGILTRTVSI